MTTRTPYHFRPMHELDHEADVDLALASGEVVVGRLLKGGVSPAARSYFHYQSGRVVFCRPIAWREVPTPEAVARWKELAAA